MSDEQFERFKKCAVDVLSVEPDQVVPEATFESLDADSLDLVELVMALEEEFDVSVEEEELEGLDIAECGVEAYNDELQGVHSDVTSGAVAREAAKVMVPAENQ